MTQSPSLPTARAPQLLVNTSSTPQSLHISTSLTLRGVFAAQLGVPMATSWRHKTALPPIMGSLLPCLLEKAQQLCPTEPSAPWTEDHSPASSPFPNSPSPRAASGGCSWPTVLTYIPQEPWGLPVDTKICRAQVPYIKWHSTVGPLYPGFHIRGFNLSNL